MTFCGRYSYIVRRISFGRPRKLKGKSGSSGVRSSHDVVLKSGTLGLDWKSVVGGLELLLEYSVPYSDEYELDGLGDSEDDIVSGDIVRSAIRDLGC